VVSEGAEHLRAGQLGTADLTASTLANIGLVPRALHISIAIGVALFVFFAYATVTGFHYNVSSIGRSSIPFLAVVDHYLGGAAVLARVGGTIAVLATLIAGANSQARMLFDGGRSGLLPARLGHLRQPGETPVNALLVMAGGGLGIIMVWWVAHLIGLDSGSTNPVGLYAECSTMGTIVILFVYLLTTLSLPVFMWRHHRETATRPPAWGRERCSRNRAHPVR
jgi:amino acid transporter